MLVVYVDDIVIIRNDTKGIDSIKNYLQKHFQIKHLESLKYFLGTEMARYKKGIFFVTEKVYTRLTFRDWDARMQKY